MDFETKIAECSSVIKTVESKIERLTGVKSGSFDSSSDSSDSSLHQDATPLIQIIQEPSSTSRAEQAKQDIAPPISHSSTSHDLADDSLDSSEVSRNSECPSSARKQLET